VRSESSASFHPRNSTARLPGLVSCSGSLRATLFPQLSPTADIQPDPQAQDQQTAVWGSISESFENIAAQTALIPAFSQEARTLLGQLQKRVAALEKRRGEFEERLLDLEKRHVDHEK